MKINQLFKTCVSDSLLEKVLFCFNYDRISKDKFFCKDDMTLYGTVERMNNILPLLKNVYLPCKTKTYLNIKDNQDAITVFRQILRLFGYKLVSKQRYVYNKKIIYYNIEEATYKQKNKNQVMHDIHKILEFSGG